MIKNEENNFNFQMDDVPGVVVDEEDSAVGVHPLLPPLGERAQVILVSSKKIDRYRDIQGYIFFNFTPFYF